jgi:hypothetical protein
MPVIVTWDNDDKTIIRYDLEGHWMWDEAAAAFDQAALMLKEVPHIVHFIVNPLDPISKSYLPPNMLANIMRIHGKAAPNAGSTLLVLSSSTVNMLLRLMGTLNPRIAARYSTVASLEEARQKLSFFAPSPRKDCM